MSRCARSTLRRKVVRAGGVEPPRACARRISYLYRIRRPRWRLGLDYPFTVPRTFVRGLGAARLSLHLPGASLRGLARDCHLQVSPTLSSSASQFPASIKLV